MKNNFYVNSNLAFIYSLASLIFFTIGLVYVIIDKDLMSIIKIYFKNGKSIQIHKFQKNFGEALYVIKDEFKDVPIEYKDKSDFFY